MKKVLTLLLTIVMVLATCCTAFAAPVGFVSSPTSNNAPVVTDTENPSEDCEAIVLVIPYSRRGELEENFRTDIENAYNSIKNKEADDSLLAVLSTISGALGIDVGDLAVSDLFNVSFTNCDTHDDHETSTVTVDADTLAHFTGLMCWINGTWHKVEGAAVSADGTSLVFPVKAEGPYAIVVDKNAVGSPSTGDEGISPVWFVLMAVSAVGLAVIAVVAVKRRSEADEK